MGLRRVVNVARPVNRSTGSNHRSVTVDQGSGCYAQA